MEWDRVTHVNADYLTFYVIAPGRKKYWPELLGISYQYYVRVIDGEIDYARESRQKIQNYINKNPIKTVSLFLDVIVKTHNDFVSWCKSRKKSRHTRNQFWKFVERLSKTMSLITLPFDIEPVLLQNIEKTIGKKIDTRKEPEKFREIFNILTTPSDESETLKENKSLLEIAVCIRNDPKLRDLFKSDNKRIMSEIERLNIGLWNKIMHHREEYAWMGFCLLSGKPAELDFFLNRIRENIKENPEKKCKDIVDARIAAEKKIEEIMDRFEFSDEFRKLVELMRKTIYLRTFRIEQINKGIYYSWDTLNRYAKHVGIDYDTLVYLSTKELEELEKKGNTTKLKAIARERQKGFGYVNDDNGVHVYTSKELDKLKKQLSTKIRDVKVLKGQLASKGKAKGCVKIVKDASDLDKVRRGDILVTKMTTPDYVAAMERSAAVVTDIGGITCHAAIVSRELGIPCVIGTEIATRVLSDGDIVSVDADKGLVEIQT